MARTAKWVKRATLTASVAVLLGLVACDRQQERIDRVGELGNAVLGQLGGEDVTSSDRDRYAGVPVEARAFAGTILARTVQVSDADVSPRFVIGSIVAKPSELPEAIFVPSGLQAKLPTLPGLSATILCWPDAMSSTCNFFFM